MASVPRKTKSLNPDLHTNEKQHVDLFRKVLIRRRLLQMADDGPIYAPFIGDADLAVDLYTDRRLYGADIDEERVAVAASKLPQADIRVADCDDWPFDGLKDAFAVADFDSYAYPYHSFRSFWAAAEKKDRLALFFTDGQGINHTFKGRWRHPDGEERFATGYVAGKAAGDMNERRAVNAFWYSKHVLPWFEDYIAPDWHVLEHFRFQRGVAMVHWAALIERRT